MPGAWNHRWDGDVLIITTSGRFTYDEQARCAADTARNVNGKSSRFGIVANLIDYPPQPPENDPATKPATEAIGRASAEGRLVGTAMVTKQAATKMQMDRFGRENGTSQQSVGFADVDSALASIRAKLGAGVSRR